MRAARSIAAHVATGILFVWILASCGASARERTISTTLTATNAAASAFLTWDKQHQATIVASSPDKEAGAKALADYRIKRLEIEQLFDATYDAIKAAATIDNDQTLHGMLAAALVISDELHRLGVLK